MALYDDFIIGPITDIYVGDFSAVTALNWLPAPRTQGGRFRYSVPEQWERTNQRFNQVADCEVSMDLTFYWSEEVHRLAMGNSIEPPLGALDAVPGNTEFTVLLLSEDPDTRSSILLPRCAVRRELSNNFQKTDATTLSITFSYRERNKQVQIFRRGTYDELATILSTRSPI